MTDFARIGPVALALLAALATAARAEEGRGPYGSLWHGAGSIWEDCYKTHSPRPAVSRCLSRAFERSEARLRQAEKAAARRGAALDAETSGSQAAEKLAAAARAFRRYRQAMCAAVKEELYGGTGSYMAAQNCRLVLTEERIKALESRQGLQRPGDR